MTRTFFLRLWRASLVLMLLGSTSFSFLAWQDAREARDVAAAAAKDIDVHQFTSNEDYKAMDRKVDHLNDVVEVVSEVLAKHAGY
jgi:hypothetical protein